MNYRATDDSAIDRLLQDRGWELVTDKLAEIERDLLCELRETLAEDRVVGRIQGRLRAIADIRRLPKLLKQEMANVIPMKEK